MKELEAENERIKSTFNQVVQMRVADELRVYWAERDALRATVKRLTRPVTDEEWEEIYGAKNFRHAVSAIIAARANGPLEPRSRKGFEAR